MWLMIFAVSLALGVAGALYLAGKVEKTGLFSNVKSTALTKVLAVAVVLVFVVVLCLIFDVTNTIIIIMHLAVFLLVGDLVRHIAASYASRPLRAWIFDAVAVGLCAVYLIIGWVQMHGLWETDYALFTKKDAGTIRIAHIADSHVGTGFSGKGFGERLNQIQQTQPDILVITGDFVDDATLRQDMEDACAALGEFKTKYGIYFCFGNHDRGYYSNERRGYSGDDLIAELEKNGVRVLEDESVLIDDRFYVTGRKDAGYGGSDRLSAQDLVSGLDTDKYIIMLDHQPTDYEAEEAAGIDLVLSGHTHGGQVFPLEYIQPLVSQNDNVRGYERHGNTDFIVTDGISDWAIMFKTGCRSEYNVINVSSENG
ncbi:MAG: metallophosphoesterase [Lachnospiraceae bacterium]|nr:metallophosphoesterase [Lachnospiraceae bacterium]